MLPWQDEGGQVWFTYYDPQFLAKRQGAPNCLVAQKIAKVRVDIAALAVAQ